MADALQVLSVIDLDTSQPFVSVVHAKQYDTVRTVVANLYFSGVKWYVPSSNIYTMVSYRKDDRIGGFYDQTEQGDKAVIVNGDDRSVIYINIDRNVVTTATNHDIPTAYSNGVQVEVVFINTLTNARLSSFSFYVDVEEVSVTEASLVNNPNFNILAGQIAEVLHIDESMAGLDASATRLPPNVSPTATVTGGTGAEDPYHISLGIPSMPGVTASASALASTASPTATVTGGQTLGQPFNIAFGIPRGLGVSSSVSMYGVSANSSTFPTTWVADVTELDPPDGSVVWTRVVGTYDNGQTYTFYAKAIQGAVGPPGVAVQDDPPATNVKLWIAPDEYQTVVIPDIKDNVSAPDSTYSSQKIDSMFNAITATSLNAVSYGSAQTLTENQQIQAYANLGFPNNTVGKLGYTVVT